MSNLFQKLELEAFRKGITPRTEESMAWFRRRAYRIRRVNRNELMKDEPINLKAGIAGGGMFMYFYDPKTKDKLPYYDQFPLTVIVDKAPGGFYGLNLHYLNPILRAKLLDALLDTINNKKYDETTKFRLNYKLLKNASKFKHFQPCFKHYLLDHVRSRFGHVPAPEWEIAAFLPMAKWAKASPSQVYADSKRMIR
tara:strand:- start:632 stop:1219 length:588 start_codon:yes stop_codon:yes gene_type:complete